MPYIFYCILRSRLSIEVNIGTFDKYEIRNTEYEIQNTTAYWIHTGHDIRNAKHDSICVALSSSVSLVHPDKSRTSAAERGKVANGKTNCLNWRNDSELTRCQTKPSGHLHCATNADYPRTLRVTTPKV